VRFEKRTHARHRRRSPRRLTLPIDRADAWEPAIVGSVVVLSLGQKLYSLATYSGPRGREASRPL
jgi:hypothetical protein